MVKTRTVEMQTQLVGYEFKKKGLPTDKNIAVENSKVSNDYFWKTNEFHILLLKIKYFLNVYCEALVTGNKPNYTNHIIKQLKIF